VTAITIPETNDLRAVTIDHDRDPEPFRVPGAVKITTTNTRTGDSFETFVDGQALANALAQLGYRPEGIDRA